MMNLEKLGPAERLIQMVLAYTDHMVHNRPGLVVRDPQAVVGARWTAATWKLEDGRKVVTTLQKQGRKTLRLRSGVLGDNHVVVGPDGAVVGEYRLPGLFPEVAAWMYGQVAEVWKLDNEFAARWASYAYAQDHRDLKVVLAAFMLVQARKGDPVRDGGKVAFLDEDYRDVGEAMLLIRRKDGKDLNPKLLLRIGELLQLPAVAELNRKLGFGRSARKAATGRWDKAVEKWLRHREANPQLLQGLVKAGFRTTVMELARRVGYKPTSPRFFEVLRWKQKQADDGRRTLAIGQAVAAAETWVGLGEQGICELIVREKPGFKRIVGLVPGEPGLTRAIVAAAIEAGAMSDKDLVIYTPTLEDLGLLEVQDIRERWQRAISRADDMRAANIAARVRSTETRDALVEAADQALQKAVEQVSRGLRVYFMVDVSGSMERSIESAKGYIARFLQGFPPDRIHVSIFNTAGREIAIKHPSAAGVENAFRGITAGGGTDYGAGVRALQHHKPKADEDVLMFFVGDEEAPPFEAAVKASGLAPVAFGFVKVGGDGYGQARIAVRETAARLGIPCFLVDEGTFADPYAIPRTIRALMAATPVGVPATGATAPRVNMVETILRTELLSKPAWAA